MSTILIIEDKKEEQERAVMALKANGIETFVLAGTYNEIAGKVVQFNFQQDMVGLRFYRDEDPEKFPAGKECGVKIDAVVTDLFFPRIDGEDPQPFGLAIYARCKKLHIPCFICTDEGKHSNVQNWLEEMIRVIGGGVFSVTKDWVGGFETIVGILKK